VPLLLLTNDDGIGAEGLRCLERSLEGIGDIVVVAPDRERSAVSHGLTIHAPLELQKIAPDRYTLNGTPADCVIYALAHLVNRRPDLVISGINHGANLGDDIMYSGTVAAAREASRHGIAAIAISQAYSNSNIRFDKGARFARSLAERLLSERANGGIYLNVNIPVRKARGVRITRQGCSLHFPHFNSLDRHETTFAENHQRMSTIPVDYQAIVDQYISITPLQRDQTDYTTLPSLTKVADSFVLS